ncbi:MAG: hypothetical protein AB1798_04405 [Spirochaetota bacterium]
MAKLMAVQTGITVAVAKTLAIRAHREVAEENLGVKRRQHVVFGGVLVCRVQPIHRALKITHGTLTHGSSIG